MQQSDSLASRLSAAVPVALFIALFVALFVAMETRVPWRWDDAEILSPKDAPGFADGVHPIVRRF